MRPACSSGFTLVEVLVALFILGVGVLAVAPMFVYAMRCGAVGADLGSVGAIAVERMERLRAEDYLDLAAGGSLAADVAGYSDLTDPDFVVRWRIQDNVTPPATKTLSVRVTANRRVLGLPKSVTLTTLRGRG